MLPLSDSLGRNYCTIGPYDPDAEDAEPEAPVKETQLSKLRRATFGKPSVKSPQPTDFAAEGGLDGAVESKMDRKTDLWREGLEVTLRVEIDQKDASGATKPYRFAVPALRCERA